ncbi:MAG: hypothetical protein HZA16_09365 [Nitrospirae bacterium]|nr:hypothetical protein [Nitrospirota bacterium]
MDNLSRQLIAEKENVEKAISNLETALSRDEKTVIELAATGTFLHNIYSGIENILKQILKYKGVTVPKSDTWHKELLNFSVSQGILSEPLADSLYEYLTFRHFFVHAYGFMLEEDQLKDLANNISDIWSRFLTETESFFNRMSRNPEDPLP